ncbi:MAG: hypothetical protein BWY82_01184 [Verrucomicrobia bacterium ADurb.Bin474]|nr:MAG: hypothetical protein BWY82_01184 [Verrucomicrobia bacterium ADurb.Bin474]
MNLIVHREPQSLPDSDFHFGKENILLIDAPRMLELGVRVELEPLPEGGQGGGID